MLDHRAQQNLKKLKKAFVSASERGKQNSFLKEMKTAPQFKFILLGVFLTGIGYLLINDQIGRRDQFYQMFVLKEKMSGFVSGHTHRSITDTSLTNFKSMGLRSGEPSASKALHRNLRCYLLLALLEEYRISNSKHNIYIQPSLKAELHSYFLISTEYQ